MILGGTAAWVNCNWNIVGFDMKGVLIQSKISWLASLNSNNAAIYANWYASKVTCCYQGQIKDQYAHKTLMKTY